MKTSPNLELARMKIFRAGRNQLTFNNKFNNKADKIFATLNNKSKNIIRRALKELAQDP